MKFPSIFKQRQIWIPTLFGSFMIILFSIISTVIILSNLASFLAYNDPVKGHFLIVEGWIGEPTLLEAIQEFEQGNYQYLITTGGPDTKMLNTKNNSYAEQAARFITNTGFDTSKLIVIPTHASDQNRTFLSAVMVRDWFNKKDITGDRSLNVFSSSVHARRTHILYKMAFQHTNQIGIIAANPTQFSLNTWWKSSEGAKTVITELIALTWVTCCFYPSR